MFFKAAERSGKLQHLSRIFLTSVLIIAAVAAVFALCACVSDIGTAPISPAPTGNIGIETPDVEPTDIPYEISATYELYYFETAVWSSASASSSFGKAKSSSAIFFLSQNLI